MRIPSTAVHSHGWVGRRPPVLSTRLPIGLPQRPPSMASLGAQDSRAKASVFSPRLRIHAPSPPSSPADLTQEETTQRCENQEAQIMGHLGDWLQHPHSSPSLCQRWAWGSGRKGPAGNAGITPPPGALTFGSCPVGRRPETSRSWDLDTLYPDPSDVFHGGQDSACPRPTDPGPHPPPPQEQQHWKWEWRWAGAPMHPLKLWLLWSSGPGITDSSGSPAPGPGLPLPG